MSETASSLPLSAEIQAGAALFDAGRWYEAHEAWEEHWLAASGHERLFLQGLIQLAGALHKGLRMGHPTGMQALAHQAAQKLAHVSGRHPALGGLDVAGAARLANEVEVAAEKWAQRGGEYDGPRPMLESVAVVAVAAGSCGCG